MGIETKMRKTILSIVALCCIMVNIGKAEDSIVFAEYSGVHITQLNGLQGAISSEGSIILDCVYDAVMIPEFGLIRCVKDNKWGLFDVKGNELLPCEYDFISPFNRRHSLYNQWLSCYYTGDSFGLIDTRGNMMTQPLFDTVANPLEYLFMNGLAVKKDNLWGVISPSDGSIIVPFKYDSFELIPYEFVFIPYGSEYFILPETDLMFTDGLSIHDITATDLDITPFELWLDTIRNVYLNTHWIVTNNALEQIGIITNTLYITDTDHCLDRGISRHYHKQSDIVVYISSSGEVIQCISNAETEYAWEAFGMVEW